MRIEKLTAVATLTALVACGSETTSPDSVTPVTVDLKLARGAGVTGQVQNGLQANLVLAEAKIDVSVVETFDVVLSAVEVHTPGSGWAAVDLTGGSPIELDLLAVPESDPILLGSLDITPGECRVRIFFSEAAISFKEELRVGRFVYQAFEDYDLLLDGADDALLKIPSGAQSGIKAEGTCEVSDGDTDLILTFSEGSTLGTIAVTGSGKIIATPVLHIASGDGGV